MTRKRVSVTSVTAPLGHSAANAGDVSWFGCGVARAVPFVANPFVTLVAHRLGVFVAFV